MPLGGYLWCLILGRTEKLKNFSFKSCFVLCGSDGEPWLRKSAGVLRSGGRGAHAFCTPFLSVIAHGLPPKRDSNSRTVEAVSASRLSGFS